MTRHRAAVLGAAVFTGFIVSSYIGTTLSFAAFAGLAVLAALSHFIIRKNTAAFVLSGLSAAFLFYAIYSAIYILPAAPLYGRSCEVTARIVSVSPPDNDTSNIIAEGTADGVPVRFSFYSPDIGMEPGDTIEGRVRFSAPLITASYSGNYDYSRGIFLRCKPEYIDISSKGGGFSLSGALAGFSEYLRGLIREELTGEEGGLMLAMCFGDKSRLDADISDTVTRSGLSHMTAVSGMHIGLIVTTLMTLLGMTGLRKRRVLWFFSAALFSLTFMLFFGFTASVCRSGIMLMLCYGADLSSRRSSPLDSLGAAVLVILLSEPCACRDAGLMLSVCGTFGAGYAAPRLTGLLRAHFRLPKAADFVIVCVCASYFTLPVSALVFGKISLVSVITSVAVFPMFFCVMILALVTAFSGGLLAPLTLLPAGLLLKLMIAVMRFFAGFRYSCIDPGSDTLIPFLAVSGLFIAAVLIIASKSRSRAKLVTSAAVICLCAFAGMTTAQKVSESGITKISVFSDGKDMLVTVANDTGISAYSTEVNRRLSSAAYKALSSRGAQRFDLLCVLAEKKHGSVYSRAFDSLGALEKHYLDNTGNVFDVGGKYTAAVYEDAVCLEINGVSVVLTDAAEAEVYPGHDIAIYSGYKKSAKLTANGTAILCDKRYSDVPGAYNAYYDETEILISPDGKYKIN